ncbi:MAG: patatin-like phospholipase family protein, partial [Saprospiraceae bacterium]
RKLAIATYKDDDLPNDLKYKEATRLICEHYAEAPQDIDHWEAAGILGSIYKKRWRFGNQVKHLYQALKYYERGFQLWQDAREALSQARLALAGESGQAPADIAEEAAIERLTNIHRDNLGDEGYNGINVAFICDLLRSLQVELEDCTFIEAGFLRKAKQVREKIEAFCEAQESEYERKIKKAILSNAPPPDTYWFYSTWMEVLLGLGRPQEAVEVLKMEGAEDWKLETINSQITALIELLYGNWQVKQRLLHQAIAKETASGIQPPPDPQREAELLRYDAFNRIFNMLQGGSPKGHRHGEKIGLALSGGGFRAALFHIGVLARLAESGLLKYVEVISCVSGGSIIGAYYYLHLKNLLEQYPDSEITDEQYVGIVKRIEKEFLANINCNLRLGVFSDLRYAWRIGAKNDYTRTERMAELYEKALYAPLLSKKESDPYINMKDLFIKPFNQPNFNIRKDNATRLNKVPMLVLNATSLNTGHCWQFTASWMGEPPGFINNEHDARPAYRRMYYDEAPDPHKSLRLATAVAASSCVPGLFAPVRLEGLYAEGRTLQLVDGGVFDNQGINTLLEQECNVLLISDASGQMSAEDKPSDYVLEVIPRTNAILQERLRDNVFFDLRTKHTAGLVRGYALMHLTKGLPSEVVDWLGCLDKYEFLLDEMATRDSVYTAYRIRKDIEEALARVRTDLDAFHETEAYALMYAGYKMTTFELKEGPASIFKETALLHGHEWTFQRIAPIHNSPKESVELLRKLKVSENLLGKVFLLSPKILQGYKRSLKILAILLGISSLVILVYIGITWKDVGSFCLKLLTLPIIAIVLIFIDIRIWKRRAYIVKFFNVLTTLSLGLVFSLA